MEKTRCPLRLVVIFKNYFFGWLNFATESVNQRCTQTGVPEWTPAGVSMFQPEPDPES